MRILNFILAIMFLAFAFLQLNDPDPVLWILVYGVMAVLCILAMFEFYLRKVLIVTLIIFVGFSTIYIGGVMEWLRQDNLSVLFDDVMKMEHPYIEESREFLGLMICVMVLVFHIVQARKK